jgi:acyl carrier protein
MAATNDTQARLRDVFANALNQPPEKITPTTTKDTLPSWDSLRHLMLITAVENEFKIRIPMTEAIDIRSFGQLLQAVLKRMK